MWFPPIKYCELHHCNTLDPNPPHYMDATSFSLLWYMRSNTCQKLLTLWFHFSVQLSAIAWRWSSLNIKLILYLKQLKKIIFNKTKSIIIRVCLVHVFKNWKLLFENICGNTCGWKNGWECVKCCLKTKNCCLKIQTKHHLSLKKKKSYNIFLCSP